MSFAQLIFDLDNTLYPASRGVVERVDARINHYLVERLGMAVDVAGSLRARYRDAYGTTLNGLMRHHAVDPDDYLTTVHEIGVEELLSADAALGAMLTALPQPKAVFTNGSAGHAERVLSCLGIRSHFAQVFSLESVAYVPKPERIAFETVLARLGVDGPACVFVDDRTDNLATARALGMRTVLVGERASTSEVPVDGAIASIHDLASLLATF